MNTTGIDQLLSQLTATAAAAAGKSQPQPVAGTADFATALQGAIEQVRTVQNHASTQAEDFQLGKPGVNVQEVMVSLQKASLSFQTMVQVRNKLTAAYQDVMNMQV
ncbi:MAG: flagellar hook-basal body complex protein FliE [Methylophilales bacterium]|nr:flagellar hook-basal body complex protein FliE [Methylophilales bacterium]